GELRVFGLAGNLSQRLGSVVQSVLAALVRGKVEMAEAVAAGQGELIAVLLEPSLELRGRRLVRRGHVFGEELHLLRHAALHDGVVFIEAHGQRLAIEDLFANLVFHHSLKLGGSRLAMPLRLEVHIHRAKIVEAESNLLRRLDAAATTLEVPIRPEQHDPQQQKVQKRFSEPAFDYGRKPRTRPRRFCRGLRLRNYGHFIHQMSPTKERQIISSGSYAAGVFCSLNRATTRRATRIAWATTAGHNSNPTASLQMPMHIR